MELGRTLNGRYTLLRLIGEGGMGAVYEARHTGTGRRVAVKQITGDIAKNNTLRARFEVEAKAAGQLETQHVAQVLDVDTDETGAPYIVMEYLAGEDLGHVLKRTGPLPPELAVKLAIQACLGLEKAHDAGIVHRDIKPANIFLAERDSGDVVVKLLDFGIAKVTSPDSNSSTLTRSGSLLGSPLYMSPEQARGIKKLDHRSDIWSFGMVLYQMLAGATPYHHIDAMGELIITICSGPPPSVHDAAPWVTDELAGVVARALAFKPEDRYQRAGDMASALKALAPKGWTVHRDALVGLPDEVRSSGAARARTAATAAAAGTPITPAPSSRPPHGDLGAATTIRVEGAGGAGDEPASSEDRSKTASISGETTDEARRDTTGGTGATGTRPKSSRRAMLALGLAMGGLAAMAGILGLRAQGGSGEAVGPTATAAAPTGLAAATVTAARDEPAVVVVVEPRGALASAEPTGTAAAPVVAMASGAASATAAAKAMAKAGVGASAVAAAPSATASSTGRGAASTVATGTKPKGKPDDVWGRE